MSKIAKHLVKAIFEWCDDPTSPSGFDAAEAAIDKALEGKIIKKSELDGLRHEAASRVHTVIPVSEHETIKYLKEINANQSTMLTEAWADNAILRDEIARRIDLDIARSACVDIEPPACLGPLDALIFAQNKIVNDFALACQQK